MQTLNKMQRKIVEKMNRTIKLNEAAEKGNLSALKKIIAESKQGLESFQQLGILAFHYAARNGHIAIVETLIAEGVDINGVDAADKQLRTALHHASIEGRVEIVKCLLAHPKIKIDTPNAYGITPLMVAVGAHKDDLIDLLVAAKADVNFINDKNITNDTTLNPLDFSLQYFNLATTRKLLELKADVNLQNAQGHSAFMKYCSQNNVSIIQLLHQAKGDINAVSKVDRYTPLLVASQMGCNNTIRYLLNANANLESIHPETNRTPLFMAIQNQHDETVKILLEHKANINHRIEHEVNPLAEAALRGNLATIKLLVKAGLDINEQTTLGATPLMFSMIREIPDESITAWFLENGADPLTTTKGGLSAIDYAARAGSVRLVTILLQFIMNKMQGDSKSFQDIVFNLFKITLNHGHSALFKFFITQKPYSHVIQSKLDQAFHFAICNSYDKGVELLLNHSKLVDPNYCEGEPIGIQLGTHFSKGLSVIFQPTPPIILAAAQGEFEIVKLLIQAGADFDCATRARGLELPINLPMTPLMVANLFNHKDIAHYLLSKIVTKNLSFAPKLQTYMSKNLSKIKEIREFIDGICLSFIEMSPETSVFNDLTISLEKFRHQKLIPRKYCKDHNKDHKQICLLLENIVLIIEKLYFRSAKGKMSKVENNANANANANKELEQIIWEVINARLNKFKELIKQTEDIEKNILDFIEGKWVDPKAFIFEQSKTLNCPLIAINELFSEQIEEVEKMLADSNHFHEENSKKNGHSNPDQRLIEKNKQLQLEIKELNHALSASQEAIKQEHEKYHKRRQELAIQIKQYVVIEDDTKAHLLFSSINSDEKLSQPITNADLHWDKITEIFGQLAIINKKVSEQRLKENKTYQAAIKAEQKQIQKISELQEQEKLQALLENQRTKLAQQLECEEQTAALTRKKAYEKFQQERQKFAKKWQEKIAQNKKMIEESENISNSLLPREDKSADLHPVLEDQDVDWYPKLNEQELTKALTWAIDILDQIIIEIKKTASLFEISTEKALGRILAHRNALFGASARIMEIVKDLNWTDMPFPKGIALKYRNVIFHAITLCPTLDALKKEHHEFYMATFKMTESFLIYIKEFQQYYLHIEPFKNNQETLENKLNELTTQPLFQKIQSFVIEDNPSLETCKRFQIKLQAEAALYDNSICSEILSEASGYSQGTLGALAAKIKQLYFKEEFLTNPMGYRLMIKQGKQYRHLQPKRDSIPGLYFNFKASNVKQSDPPKVYFSIAKANYTTQ